MLTLKKSSGDKATKVFNNTLLVSCLQEALLATRPFSAPLQYDI